VRVGPPRVARVFVTTVAVVAAFAIIEIVRYAVLRPWWERNDFENFMVAGPLAIPVAVLAPKVSYRARDCWWVVIPYCALFLVAVCVWRSMLLPYRNWPPRPDEQAAIAYCPGQVADGRLVYRLDPASAQFGR
jgi:hypothetical protein